MGQLLTTACVEQILTPTLDTSAYAAGDRLGSIMTLSNVCRNPGGMVELVDILLVDATATSGISVDVLFFDSLPTVASADNAAINISDAEMLKLCGSLSLLTGNYKSTASNGYIYATDLNMLMKPVAPSASAGIVTSSNLYALMVLRAGTPTFAANSIQLRMRFKQLN